ncbi:MAG: DNA translocase FtsK 4TM domain-containing protein, partial [Parachlamydiaceae bacterium]
MADKKSKKKSKDVRADKPISEVRAFGFLSFSLITLLSLLSFAFDSSHHNLLGIMGQHLGWLFHALFGVGSYLVCFYVMWLSWRLLFQKEIARPVLITLTFVLMLCSFCLLLCVIEESLPYIGAFLQKMFYPGLWEKKMRFHLGGAFFQYIYLDLPLLNLHHIFNSIGTAILTLSTFVTSLLLLARTSPSEILKKFKDLFPPRPKELLTVKPKAESTKPMGGFLRYVKLRIPQGAHSQTTENSSAASTPQHELLEIQPEQNLTARPSLSNKQSVAIESVKEAYNKPKKSESLFLPVEPTPPVRPTAVTREQKRLDAIDAQRVHNGDFSTYKVPGGPLLSQAKKVDQSSLKNDLKRQAEVLEETLQSFGIEAKVGQINCGPTINSFEVHPSIGVKVQKIKALENDIALNMEAKSI